ncbi:hypothetical protein V493_08717 [Pseudogymnoascus sp. VKM F-4281 (FW-2241)]|nr:hypothetical protein V493_08717 [Pseudogymnoascus sp. VKM F-4281 (FW-2241)]
MSTIPHGRSGSPQSSELSETTNHKESLEDAKENTREKRKRAAAKALAAQSRLRSKPSNELTSSVKTASTTNNPSQAAHTEPITNNSKHTAAAAASATTVSPKKLSPSNYAKIGARFEVQFLTMKDETIKCDDPGYMSKQMFLEWDGIDKEALKIVNGDKECLLIEFSTIQRVSYNPTGQHLQLIFNTTAQEELETVVIAMNALPREEWIKLQQLFRQVERKWRIRCDQEDMSFFDAAIKSMRKKLYKKTETPYINRSDAVANKSTERLLRSPRRKSVSTASRRQSIGPNLNTTSKIVKTLRNKIERPKVQLSVEVRNIMAAKVIDQPLQIPPLMTPSRPASATSSLMSRTSQSPLKEGTEFQRNDHRGYSDRDSPTKRSFGRQDRSQVPQPSATFEPDVNSSATLERVVNSPDVSSLFGSDDSERDLLSFEQPNRTPSQRFIDQMNEAKIISSKNYSFQVLFTFDSPKYAGSQLHESTKINPSHFAQLPVSEVRDRSTQGPKKPDHGFEHFMNNVHGSTQIPSVLVPSSPNIRQNGNRLSSLAKSAQPLNLSPVKLTIKRPQNAEGIPGFDRVLKKPKESHSASLENEAQFYYQCKSGQDFLLPVAINDQVVRLRTKREMEESGKQSKYDVFDGPWIKLNFPEASKADPWVEISRLLPVIDPNYIVAGTAIPTSLEVSTHISYIELIDKLRVQPLAPDSHNSFVKKRSTDAVDDKLYVVEVRKGKFAVFVDIDHKGIDDSYEVAKIRQKRLRLYNKAEAKRMEVLQYNDDKWVKRLSTQHSGISQDKIIVDEYLCSWAGWATEDQTWVSRDNFSTDALLKLFDEQNDPFRDIPDDIVVPVDDLVYNGDLKNAQAAAVRRSKRSSTGSNCQSSGDSAKETNQKLGTARQRRG